eukprot:CAMPEP_0185189630 /NCGR_PEP_ID=MMETSP1140-20130426/6155_1 /TAXON_ID=298111 /ORGANISM="Pavlova sp., Strain CCMP459" /LENGTH=1008 /DNA_ID=CAMNT_0027756207 /DNA_START=1 /DNA_END=3023 /DNA_ORIENTATION=+
MIAAGVTVVLLAAFAARAPPLKHQRVHQVHGLHISRLGAHGRSLAEGEVADDVELNFNASNRLFKLELVHHQSHAPGAVLTLLSSEGKQEVPIPKLANYRGTSDSGGGAHVQLRDDGTVAMLIRNTLYDDLDTHLIVDRAGNFPPEMEDLAEVHPDTIIMRGASEIPVQGEAPPHEDGNGVHATGGLHEHSSTTSAAAALRTAVHANANRTTALGERTPVRVHEVQTEKAEAHGRRLTTSFGRLIGCPAAPRLYLEEVGILVDFGFARRTGTSRDAGFTSTTQEVDYVMGQTNLVFEEQVGVRMQYAHLMIAVDSGGATNNADDPSFAFPTSPGSRNTCAGFKDDQIHTYPFLVNNVVQQRQVRVNYGVYHQLNSFRTWVGNSAPLSPTRGVPLGNWHLFTDCHPPAGIVGLASLGSSCAPITHRILRETSSSVTSSTSYALQTSAGEKTASFTSYGGGCPPGWLGCEGPAAVSSFSSLSTFWRTVAHEFGHNWGAQHTFEEGGLMSYDQSEVYFAEKNGNNQVCKVVRDLLDPNVDIRACIYDNPSTTACGNGVRETGEMCDDGNDDDTDGCLSTCLEAPGFRCTEDANGKTTSCVQHCGNGVIDYDKGEQCDRSAPTDAIDNCHCDDNCKYPADRGPLWCDPNLDNSLNGFPTRKPEGCCDNSCKMAGPNRVCYSIDEDGNELVVKSSDGARTRGSCVGGVCLFGRAPTRNHRQNDVMINTNVCKANVCLPTFHYVGVGCQQMTSAEPDNPLSAVENVFFNGASCNKGLGLCQDGGCQTAGTCGDGVVQIGEECDSGATPDDCCVGCKLAVDAECSPFGRNHECCTSKCIAKPPTEKCGPNDAGVCTKRGECVFQGAHQFGTGMCESFSNMEFDPVACPALTGYDDGCRVGCYEFGQKFCKYDVAGAFFPDGTACSLSGSSSELANTGKCLNHKCVSKTFGANIELSSTAGAGSDPDCLAISPVSIPQAASSSLTPHSASVSASPATPELAATPEPAPATEPVPAT